MMNNREILQSLGEILHTRTYRSLDPDAIDEVLNGFFGIHSYNICDDIRAMIELELYK